MNIKSLLLGSAAALVAVSGARAADAVVIPEPEAVEYVRVCDAAGAGYFYIPGGETCLKISGYVQYEMTFDNGNDAYDKNYEARLQFDAWRDTSYGPLATQIRLTAAANGLARDHDTTLDGLVVDRAYFDLAGLRVGIDASAWDYGFGGPADAYNVGADEVATMRYTANFGAGSFTLSLEEDSTATDYVPSVLGVVAISAGDFAATLGAVYEDDANTWGAKATASYTAGAVTFGAGVQYSDALGGTYNTAYEWVLGADVLYDAGALDLGLGFQYGIDDVFNNDEWTIGALVSYDVTETLNANLRLRYDENKDFSARVRFRSSF
ncbi:porin [Ahrensia kielensis]|uniref:Porin n=1 Tax=Ahrensia kielensis TaxID=76980 RepID=A0ABU9T2X2_9HYPH